MDRATRKLRPDHDSDGDGGRSVAADRAVLCRADRGARERDLHRGCAATCCWLPCSCFLILRQVMPIAAGLAGGVALSSFGLVESHAELAARRDASRAGCAAREIWRRARPGVARGPLRRLRCGQMRVARIARRPKAAPAAAPGRELTRSGAQLILRRPRRVEYASDRCWLLYLAGRVRVARACAAMRHLLPINPAACHWSARTASAAAQAVSPTRARHEHRAPSSRSISARPSHGTPIGRRRLAASARSLVGGGGRLDLRRRVRAGARCCSCR